jgi:PTS system nitrogen regulatory IIA component
MKLNAILSADRVISGVSVTSKKKALEELSRLLAKGTDTLSATDIFNGLTAREKLGSTGLGHGVAIPHGRMAGVSNSVGAFIRLRHAVDYDAHDGQAVDLAFGLVVPVAATEEHLKHLAAIAEKFSDEEFCKKMRAAKDDRTLHELLVS